MAGNAEKKPETKYVAAAMRYCRNYFEAGSYDGLVTIQNGEIVNPAISGAPYVAIKGSAYNNGVFALGVDAMTDETFSGRVWALTPPAGFLALCAEIASYDQKNPAGAYVSESFGNYSYQRAQNTQGQAASWQGAFSSRLADYQRIVSEVMA